MDLIVGGVASEDLFPTPEEILTEGSTVCELCQKVLSNSSALRLHRVKFHRDVQTEKDRRILRRETDVPAVKQIYHCPDELCLQKGWKCEGMRNLRQHYVRVHCEKHLSCECGVRFSLNKDLLYHKKTRCSLRPNKDAPPTPAAPRRVAKPKKRSAAAPLDPLMEHISPMGMEMPPLGEEMTTAAMGEDIPIVEVNLNGNVATQPIILIVPATDVQETIRQLTQSLKSTATVGVQATETQRQRETNTIAVGEPLPPTQFCDFSGQYNAPCDATTNYYYTTGPDVRDTSTGTDFTLPSDAFLQYPSNVPEFAAFDYSQQAGGSNIPTYQEEQPPRRSFGTTMEDFTTHSRQQNDFDLLRDIETQTMGEKYWQGMKDE